jgi:primase-polymerase (primpol)-like protein
MILPHAPLGRNGQGDVCTVPQVTMVVKSERPSALAIVEAQIPSELRRLARWVCWRYQWDGERWKKPPVNPANGRLAKTTDPTTWRSFLEALEHYERHRVLPDDEPCRVDGIGFVFTSEDNLIGIDLDRAIDAQTRQLKPWARELVEQLKTYTEYSPGGTGLRLFGRGTISHAMKRPHHDGIVEIYAHERYLTVTGHHLEEAPGELHEITTVVGEIQQRLLPAQVPDATK